jgi:hypothetical protein
VLDPAPTLLATVALARKPSANLSEIIKSDLAATTDDWEPRRLKAQKSAFREVYER